MNEWKIVISGQSPWRKTFDPHLPPLWSRVRVTLTPCGFRWWMKRGLGKFSRGFSRFPCHKFHYTISPHSSHSSHFISSCDEKGVVNRHPCHSLTFNIETSPHLIRRWLKDCISAVLGHQNESEQIVTPVRSNFDALQLSNRAFPGSASFLKNDQFAFLYNNTKHCRCFWDILYNELEKKKTVRTETKIILRIAKLLGISIFQYTFYINVRFPEL